MNKDFEAWNNNKTILNLKEDYMPHYKEREIRWCHLGLNIGFEQDGKGLVFARPVLIIKGFNRRVCLIVPLTSSLKSNKYYIKIGIIGGVESSAIISQIRLIDTRRLGERIGMLNINIFAEVKNKIKDML